MMPRLRRRAEREQGLSGKYRLGPGLGQIALGLGLGLPRTVRRIFSRAPAYPTDLPLPSSNLRVICLIRLLDGHLKD